MLSFVLWYLLITLFGLAAAPLAWTWLRWLPDRGLSLSRPLGWLLAGWLIWFLGSLGFATLSAGSGVGGVIAVAGFSMVVLWRWGGGWAPFGAWLREHRALLLMQEVLFVAALALWAFYRAHDNGIAATEKPMEFAFLNSIVKGGQVPPIDPWLSGFAISYYYFGYLLVGMLTLMSGLSSEVTFNLTIALLFALAALGAFGLAYNLIAGWFLRTTSDDETPTPVVPRWVLAGALLGPLLLLGVSNLTGMAEITNANGLGSTEFYQALDIKNFPAGQRPASGWYPDTNWWWWRASRTVHDRVPLTDQDAEVIDEFPFFSFLLGDMHPHVLALPFDLLALAVALNLLRGALLAPVVGPRVGAGERTPTLSWRGVLLPAWTSDSLWGGLSLLLGGLIVGGLYFLNSWDWPTYTFLFVVAWTVGAVVRRGGLDRVLVVELLTGILALVLLGVLCYLPFHIGFRSQARGISWVNPLTKTQLRQYLLMFGLFYTVLIPFLTYHVVTLVRSWRAGDEWAQSVARPPLSLLTVAAVPLAVAFIGLAFRWWTVVVTGLVIGLAWVVLAHWVYTGLNRTALVAGTAGSQPRPAIAGGSGELAPRLAPAFDPNLLFALLLFATAVLLTLGTEFFYIQDTFGSRMNTVFKLWYQAWTLMAVASAFGAVWLLRQLALPLRLGWGVVFGLLCIGSMLYPIGATLSKANGFEGGGNLNGMAWFANIWPDDYQAIQWLKTNVPGQPTILEATGGQYSEYARVSTQTGLPTVLGWGGHELQWRGNYDEPGRREPDIRALYETTDPKKTRELLDKYMIKYVYIGDLERRTYNLTQQQIDKFRLLMAPVYQQGNVIIFGR